MKYIKLYEDLDFDPNNFRKLRKDIKAIGIELIDNGFKVQPYEVENDNGFDNFDFYVKIHSFLRCRILHQLLLLCFGFDRRIQNRLNVTLK